MLHELKAYAERQLPDSEPGFKTREVRWYIELAADGRFLNVVPLGDGKKGESQPRCPDMHGMNAGGKAHFLVETAQTAALLFKADEDPKKITTVKKRHHFFVGLLRKAAESTLQLKRVADLFGDASHLAKVREALAAHKAKPTDWIGWRVGGVDPRLDQEVQAWWRTWRQSDLGDTKQNAASGPEPGRAVADGAMVCFLTGESVAPLATHPKITGLSRVGGLGMGDVMVGFDKAAFGSYGLDQSANAAMSTEATQKYVDGLNDLVKNHARTLAGALVVHWFKEHVAPENDPLAFLHGLETSEQTEAAALAAVRRLLESIRSGQRADLGDNRYYALTISGAAGRAMVRDWMEGQFEELATSIEHWFSDLEITARSGKKLAPGPKLETVVTCLLAERKPKQKYEDWIKPISPARRQLLQAAVRHQQIPFHALTGIVALLPSFFISEEVVRALFPKRDQANDDKVGLTISRLYARMGLLKTYFIRKNKGGDPNMTPYLNPEHPSPAYHCGRLLAVLAELQHAAFCFKKYLVVLGYYPPARLKPGFIFIR